MISENKIQSECFKWHWNTYPEQRGLLCYNLNNSRNKIDGMQNKALGLIKGRSDMVYYHPLRGAIMIEFKTDTGVQSPEQKEWEKKITNAGYQYHIIRSLTQFKKLIENFNI